MLIKQETAKKLRDGWFPMSKYSDVHISDMVISGELTGYYMDLVDVDTVMSWTGAATRDGSEINLASRKVKSVTVLNSRN